MSGAIAKVSSNPSARLRGRLCKKNSLRIAAPDTGKTARAFWDKKVSMRPSAVKFFARAAGVRLPFSRVSKNTASEESVPR